MGVFSVCGFAANIPVREVTSQATRAGNQLVPGFYKGYVYWIGRDGDDKVANVYAPDGHLALVFVTENGKVQNLAFDTDGTVAVSWWGPKKTGGIDFRDSYGKLTRTVETGRYLPAHIAFGEDHSLWIFGYQLDAADREDQHDYMTIRKYTPDGKQAGAYLARSLFPAGLSPAGAGWQARSIFVTHDRVGLWAWSGDTGSKTEWLELDLNGKLLCRKRLDEFNGNMGIALTNDGHLYLQSHRGNPKDQQLYALDRDSSTWHLVENPPAGYLEGADEDTLEFSDIAGQPIHIRWYQQP